MSWNVSDLTILKIYGMSKVFLSRWKNIYEISGFHGGEYEDVFWDVAPYSLEETDRRFRGVTASIIKAP
jgi:hypothetical protein